MSLFFSVHRWTGIDDSPALTRRVRGLGKIVAIVLIPITSWWVVIRKDDHAWSNLSSPISSFFTGRRLPKPFLPTPENWAAKEHIETGVLPPPKPERPSHGAPLPTTLQSECAAIGIRCNYRLFEPVGPQQGIGVVNVAAVKELESPVKFRVECTSQCREYPLGASPSISYQRSFLSAKVSLQSDRELDFIIVLLPSDMPFKPGMEFQFQIYCANNPRGCDVTEIKRPH